MIVIELDHTIIRMCFIVRVNIEWTKEKRDS